MANVIPLPKTNPPVTIEKGIRSILLDAKVFELYNYDPVG